MKKICLSLLLLLQTAILCAHQYSQFNGKIIKNVNVKTAKISPKIICSKFTLKENSKFDSKKFEHGKKKLHDMRIFKTIDFFVSQNSDDTLNIDIDAKDGSFVFPFLSATGGSSNGIVVLLAESNWFSIGEMSTLMGFFSSKGYFAATGFGVSKTFINFAAGNLNQEEKVYANNSYSASGIFSSQENNFTEIRKYNLHEKFSKIGITRQALENISVSAEFNFSEVSYSQNGGSDGGFHNKAVVTVAYSNNMQTKGSLLSSIGAIFGVGLSDFGERFENLKKEKYGYLVSLSYENGGNWTGADYEVSKIYLRTGTSIEFKNRNILTLNLTGANIFESTFHNLLKSEEALNAGDYSREFRGKRGTGIGLAFTHYLLTKSELGFVTAVPFAETAFIWDEKKEYNISGIGIGFFYTFLKIPIPLGLKYTYNVSDGSYNISFLFGGGF
jgi:hypothetical protein